MKPLVSICCITYNHEKYIKDALDSFIMQETPFPFEILVHDDASTDKTAEIIRAYHRKYPDIVKPIYQKENQFSKGKKPLHDFMMPLVTGKYIATCEGDDFWTEKDKLKKQVEFLEKNMDFTMCIHKVKIVDTNKKPLGSYLGLRSKGSKKISIKESAIGGIVHVSSRVIRTDFFRKPLPEWILNARHDDYALSLYTAAEGQIYYIDEAMSAYRIGVENSMMTNLMINYNKEKDIRINLNRIETLKKADKYYNYQYRDEIEKVNLIYYVIISLLKNDFSGTAREKYRYYISENGLTEFLKIILLKKYPTIAGLLVALKGKISIARTL